MDTGRSVKAPKAPSTLVIELMRHPPVKDGYGVPVMKSLLEQAARVVLGFRRLVETLPTPPHYALWFMVAASESKNDVNNTRSRVLPPCNQTQWHRL